jgi:hypothetical protein
LKLEILKIRDFEIRDFDFRDFEFPSTISSAINIFNKKKMAINAGSFSLLLLLFSLQHSGESLLKE